MRKRLVGCALLSGLAAAAAIAPVAFGQAVGPKGKMKPVPVEKVEARADDVSTIEGIVKASYETISGGVGVPRQWGRDESLFDPNVRFVAVERDPKSGAIVAMITTHQEFVDSTDASLVKEGFTERELGRKIERYGNVATVLSSYEGKNASTGKVETRGVNIFQLYYDGKRWWILFDGLGCGDARESDSAPAAAEELVSRSSNLSHFGLSRCPKPCLRDSGTRLLDLRVRTGRTSNDGQ
jgi:hypothetical protein